MKADTLALIQAAVSAHSEYWDNQRPLLRKLRGLYSTRYWDGISTPVDEAMPYRVETSDAFAFIESFVSTLFTRDPAVEVGYDASAEGSPEVARAAANVFLHRQRESLERATRLALIYPMAFVKLAPRDSTDPINRVAIRAVSPWEVILDRDAERWDEQRFVGHRYYLPITEAKKRFGNKDFKAVQRNDYFENDVNARKHDAAKVPKTHLYVEIVEMYDMEEDRLAFWSPQYNEGRKLLEAATIPVRSYDDEPMCSIIPLYYAYQPDRPMDGYSALSRVYDQFSEKNIYRTFMANATRRDSRQFLVRSGAFSAEQMQKLCSGMDGAYAETDSQEPFGNLIAAVPNVALSSNLDRYLGQIESDIQVASAISVFTRGEASRATATEITALSSYAASSVGKMARERDAMIERLSKTYIRMLHLLTDEKDKAVVVVDNTPTIISTAMLDGRFRYAALDQAATPLSDALKRQQFLSILPVLGQVGVSTQRIKEYVIREIDLPESFLEEDKPEPTRLPSGADVPTGPEGEGIQRTPAEMLAQNLQSGPRG